MPWSAAGELSLSITYTALLVAVTAATLVACWREARPPGGATAVAALFVLALIAKLAAAALTGKLTAPDTYEYEVIASNALAGHGFEYRLLGTAYHAYGTPLYPLVNTAVYLVTRSSGTALLVLGALVASGTAPVAHALAARVWPGRWALLAGALVALHPPLLVYAGKLHPLGMEAFLAAASVLWGSRWLERGRRGDAIGFGAAVALGAMSRPTFLVLLVIAAVIALARWRARPGMARVSIAALAALVVLAPWSVYVSSLYGRPVFMDMTGGVVLWYGNNPAATGTAYAPDGEPILTLAPPELLARVSNTDESSADAAFVDAAISYVRADPVAFVRRYVTKLAYFWTISPTAGLLYPSAWRTAYFSYYAALAALAVLGLIVWARGPRDGLTALGLGLAMCVGVSLVQSVYYVDGRHRWEVEALLLVLVPGGVRALIAGGSRVGRGGPDAA